jgi:hypothetical protein
LLFLEVDPSDIRVTSLAALRPGRSHAAPGKAQPPTEDFSEIHWKWWFHAIF